ncbi:restriction endonuclease subunit S [Peptococcaceae bacterium]|nr:restriction endonuclease subunit S [Peptococcaceae bacterium]
MATILKDYQPLKNFVGSIIHPQEVKREYSVSGYLFVLSQNLRENYLDFSDKFYISDNIAKQISKNLLDEGDIVTVRTGSIGLSAVVSGFKEKIYASADVIVIKNPKISSFYISTFLNSKFGKLYLNRIIYGALQPHITPKLLGEIPIPLPDEASIEKIHRLVGTALDNFRQSETLYFQAENLLLEELGLKDFKIKEDLSYIVNLSEVKSAHRADAEYFQPKYEKLISKIKMQNAKFLDELFSIRRGDFISPDYYVEKAKRAYIRIKELPTRGDIDLDAITYINDNFHEKKLETLKEGDFVFAGIGATLGKTARIPKELEGSFYSNNTVRFRLKKQWQNKLDSYYLQIVFQSIVCQWQFEQKQAQTTQAKIADEELKTVLIPILPKPTQQKIADLVRQSHQACQKAKQLLEEAKNKVEALIDKK